MHEATRAWAWRLAFPARLVTPRFGGSSAPAANDAYTIEETLADMAGLHDHLGGKPTIWIGHDWGGVVLTSLAYQPNSRPRAHARPSVRPNDLPGRQYPDGRWDHYRYYTTHFEAAVADFNADVAASLALIFRPGDPAGIGKVSPQRCADAT